MALYLDLSVSGSGQLSELNDPHAQQTAIQTNCQVGRMALPGWVVTIRVLDQAAPSLVHKKLAKMNI